MTTMLYAVYRKSDGALVSTTRNARQVAPQELLDARGYAVKELNIPEWEAGGPWDPVMLAFWPRPLPEEE